MKSSLERKVARKREKERERETETGKRSKFKERSLCRLKRTARGCVYLMIYWRVFCCLTLMALTEPEQREERKENHLTNLAERERERESVLPIRKESVTCICRHSQSEEREE